MVHIESVIVYDTAIKYLMNINEQMGTRPLNDDTS